MADSTRKTGDKGELMAIRYLQNEGVEILIANYIAKGGEIDIIGKYQGEIIFYEVKYRKTSFFGSPEESLTKNKKSNILKALRYYCFENKINQDDVHFDFLAISEERGRPHIKHYKNLPLY